MGGVRPTLGEIEGDFGLVGEDRLGHVIPEGVRLSTPCLSVAHDAPVVAFYHIIDHAPRAALVHLGLRGRHALHRVELIFLHLAGRAADRDATVSLIDLHDEESTPDQAGEAAEKIQSDRSEARDLLGKVEVPQNGSRVQKGQCDSYRYSLLNASD